MNVIAGWLRLALRDMRGGVRRFAVLLACLALGVGTITIVGSVGAALQSALLRDARTVLGGDIEARLSYRAATPEERALFESFGPTGEVIEVMGRANAGPNTGFVSIKAIDETYPLVGTAETSEGDTPIAQLTASTGDGFGLVADPLLLDRLGIAIGDTLELGSAAFTLTGTISHLPDQIGGGLSLGLPVVISTEALEATGILEPGVLARYRYRMLLDGTAFDTAASAITESFPTAGWEISAPQDATADLARFFDIFSRFLTIVGLSTLLVGGVGVSNAIAAYVTERQRSIATFKALGATGGRIMGHFLLQVMLLTVVGIILGLILGAVVTIIALPILGGLLSISLAPVVDLPALLTAAGFGLLTGFVFGYLPLRRAQTLQPALLFRSAGSAVEGGLGWRDYLKPGLWLPLGIALALVFGLAVLSTGRPVVVVWVAIGSVVAIALLRAAAWLLQRLLRLIPPLPHAFPRNALKAIYRPGAPAPVVILSLGLGLALLLLIALIDGNLRSQLDAESIPDAPSFVYMDLFDDEVTMLADYTAADPQIESFSATPMITGTLSTINDTPLAERETDVPTEFSGLLSGEIPLTVAETIPDKTTITDGAWWPEDYDGTPMVSVFNRLRAPLGLELGDKLDFNIFGDTVTVTIGSFRDYAWRDGGVNFAFLFSPNTLADFPVSYLGLMKTTPGAEPEVQKRIIEDFPELIFLPVSDAIETFAVILNGVTGAIEVIGGLAVVSGVLVLAGAMAAGRRQREADAVVMKVLGATRGNVLWAYLVEYGLLGALSAVLAALIGIAGTWAFVTFLLEIDFRLDLMLVVWVVLATIALAIVVGMATTWSALSRRPATFLRQEG